MTKNELLLEYDRLVDAVEDAASMPIWRWGDWLADNVPSEQGARNDLESRGSRLTLAELAERRGHTVQHLGRIRRVAAATREDRLPDVSVRAYLAALEQTAWDLAAANERLREKGTSLRDQSGPMMSEEALLAEVEKQPVEVRYRIAEAATRPSITVAEPEETSEQQEQKRASRHALRWAEATGDLSLMRRRALNVLRLCREVGFDDEERELLNHDIDQATAILGLAKLALTGTSGVDWDAELERMTA